MWPMLDSLDLSFTKITDKVLKLLPSAYSLKYLSVAGCQITDNFGTEIRPFFSHPHNLQKLNVSDTNITDKFFDYLSVPSQKIQDKPRPIEIICDNCLSLNNAHPVIAPLDSSSESPINIQKASFSNSMDLSNLLLSKLVLHSSKFFSSFLQSIDLSMCLELTDLGVCSISLSCPLLLSLSLWGCPLITDASSACLSRGCRCLECLDLSNCERITDSSLVFLSGEKGKGVFGQMEREIRERERKEGERRERERERESERERKRERETHHRVPSYIW